MTVVTTNERLPKYELSDAPDLTQQYNTAMDMIDEKFHEIHEDVNSVESSDTGQNEKITKLQEQVVELGKTDGNIMGKLNEMDTKFLKYDTLVEETQKQIEREAEQRSYQDGRITHAMEDKDTALQSQIDATPIVQAMSTEEIDSLFE